MQELKQHMYQNVMYEIEALEGKISRWQLATEWKLHSKDKLSKNSYLFLLTEITLLNTSEKIFPFTKSATAF